MNISILQKLACNIQKKTWGNQCVSILWIGTLCKLMMLNKKMYNYIKKIRYQGNDLRLDFEWARVRLNELDNNEKSYRMKSLRHIPERRGYFDTTYQYVKADGNWENKRLHKMPKVRTNDVGKIIKTHSIVIKYGQPYIDIDINKNALSRRFFKPRNSLHYIDHNMWRMIYHVAKREMTNRVDLSALLCEKAVSYDRNTTFTIKPLETDLQLGKYQLENIKWMLELEKNTPSRISYTKAHRFGKHYVDPFNNRYFREKPEDSHIELMGGALLDEMGLGKTVVMLMAALLGEADTNVGTPDRYVFPQFKEKCQSLITSKGSKMYGKVCGAVVKEELEVYCKKHRSKHPKSTLTPPNKMLRIDNTYYHKLDDNRKLLKSRATLIICPNTVPDHWVRQCMTHIKRKTPIKILKVTCAKEYDLLCYRDLINADIVIASFDFIARNPSFKPVDNIGLATTLYQRPAYFGNVYWNRIIVDEIHEVLDKKYQRSNLLTFIMQVKTRYRWCLSGSAFTKDHVAYRTVIDFLMSGGNASTTTQNIFPYLERHHHVNIIQNYFRRNTFQSTCAEKITDIPPVLYKEIWLEFSKTERAMYNTRMLTSQKRGDAQSDEYLRQLCCHPQLSAETKGALEECGSLKQIHESMKQQTKDYIASTENEIETLEERLDYLSQFLDAKQKTILPMYLQQDDCPDYLTMNKSTKSLLTRRKKQLTNLRKALAYYGTGNNKPDTVLDKLEAIDTDDIEYLIHLYGTKMGHLVQYFKNDFQEHPDDCAIIFSQWDTLLKNIQITLKKNGIDSICCKGNVFQKRKAIEKFKEQNKGIRILLLSTKYAASGLDLMEANKIILFDPVYGTEKYKHGIEAQAIGRAARLGQERMIEVIRFLVRDTIEEELHYSKVPKEKLKNIKII